MFVRIKKVGIACKIEIQYESCFSTALHKSYEPIMASVGGFVGVCMQIAEIASTFMTVGNLQKYTVLLQLVPGLLFSFFTFKDHFYLVKFGYYSRFGFYLRSGTNCGITVYKWTYENCCLEVATTNCRGL